MPIVLYIPMTRRRRVRDPRFKLFPAPVHHALETGIIELLVKIAVRFAEDEVDVDGEFAVSGCTPAKIHTGPSLQSVSHNCGTDLPRESPTTPQPSYLIPGEIQEEPITRADPLTILL